MGWDAGMGRRAGSDVAGARRMFTATPAVDPPPFPGHRFAVSYSSDGEFTYRLQLWKCNMHASPATLVLACEVPLFTHVDFRGSVGDRLAFGGATGPLVIVVALFVCV